MSLVLQPAGCVVVDFKDRVQHSDVLGHMILINICAVNKYGFSILPIFSLCPYISCLVIGYMGLIDYLECNKDIMITRTTIQSKDIPAFAASPETGSILMEYLVVRFRKISGLLIKVNTFPVSDREAVKNYLGNTKEMVKFRKRKIYAKNS